MSNLHIKYKVALGAVLLLLVFGPGLARAADAASRPTAPQVQEDKSDPKWLLFVSDDEAATEKQIAAYFEKFYRKTSPFYQNKTNPRDIWLAYTLAPQGAPKVRVMIDTDVSARNHKTKEILERRVKIFAYYTLPASIKSSSQYRAVILELNNDFMNRYWVPNRIKITRKGNVAFETSINIPGQKTPVHPEMVWDQLTRMVSVWKAYYNELKNKVPLGGQ